MKKLSLMAVAILGFSSAANLKAQSQFVGQIMFVPYSFAPVGWHDCDGALLQISEYETLFTLIGTTYGGDGQTTFAVPNAKGRVIIDDGMGSGSNNYALGQSGGVESVTLTTNQLPIHTHQVMSSNNDGNRNIPTNSVPANTKTLDKEYSNLVSAGDKVTMKPGMLSSSGGNQAHNNMMPTLALKCVIALEGVYPTPN
ncbi:MAG: tail fiber protein [Weeksellaceae bacterium]|nr:tail fiber protein [Weeksellaceae bacterium]